MGTLLTVDDIRKRQKCGRDAAYQMLREAGGRKFGGVWKIREERFDAWELGTPLTSKPQRPFSIPDHAAELLAD